MSLGGFRDPRDPDRDAYSQLEAAAVGYAHGKGVVVVAAVGNSDEAPPKPWPYASYPAALPHVLGVSALARDGSVPAFSNRDTIYNDIAAPGRGDPLHLPARADRRVRRSARSRATRPAPSTSRGLPQGRGHVLRRAAGERRRRGAARRAPAPAAGAGDGAPDADGARRQRGDRLSSRARRSATRSPAGAGSTSRRRCASSPAQIPRRDRSSRTTTPATRLRTLWGQTNRIEATLDFWDDQNDVYAIRLRRGQPVYVSVRGPAGYDANLILWSPGTTHIDDLASRRRVARQSARPGAREWLSLPRAEGRHLLRPGEARRAAAPAATSS